MKEKQLKRDNFSKAILNVDTASYKQFKYDELKTRQLNNTMIEVNQLKNDVYEIKEMMKLLLNGKNNG